MVSDISRRISDYKQGGDRIMDKFKAEQIMKSELTYQNDDLVYRVNETAGMRSYSIGDFQKYDTNFIREYYPTYYPAYFNIQKSTLEQAFKVVSKLVAKGHFKNLTVAKFMELVNLVSETL